MISRKEYAERFLESTESIWGKDLLKPYAEGIKKTGEAVWEVDNLDAKSVPEPTKPSPPPEDI